MTTDRAWKLGQLVAAVVLENGPHTEAELHDRIRFYVADLLLNVDLRMMPEDQPKREVSEIFDGQLLGLPL
jgi:hypothetical protein